MAEFEVFGNCEIGRRAVNALVAAVGAPEQFTSTETQLSALVGRAVKASDFTSLMTKLNTVRGHAKLAIGPAEFTQTPQPGGLVTRAGVQ